MDETTNRNTTEPPERPGSAAPSAPPAATTAPPTPEQAQSQEPQSQQALPHRTPQPGTGWSTPPAPADGHNPWATRPLPTRPRPTTQDAAGGQASSTSPTGASPTAQFPAAGHTDPAPTQPTHPAPAGHADATPTTQFPAAGSTTTFPTYPAPARHTGTSPTTPLPSAGQQPSGQQAGGQQAGGQQAGGVGGSPPPPAAAGGAGGPGDFGGSAFAGPAVAEPARPEPRKRGRMWLAALAIGAVLGGGAGAATVAILDDDAVTTSGSSSLDDSGSDDSSNRAPEAPVLSDVGEVADQVLPSVVSIQAEVPGGTSGGSGVIISEDGQILTNNHVVQGVGQGGDGGQVTVTFSDGTTAQAEVVGTDPITDVAVLQAIDVSGLTPADLGSSDDVTVGQQVVAIGSPLGLDGTVTTGIVSALDRTVLAGDGSGQSQPQPFSAIQTDAPINPGNSGGPLVNMSGEVVGINSAILTTGTSSGSIGLGFSIPIDQARPIAQELIDSGEATHAQIGVRVGNPDDGTRGALIASVDPNTPADDAGIQEGDIVTKLDDRVITDPNALIAAARSYRPGDEITLTIQRDGEEVTVDLTLGSDAPST